ncbi:hypothetical protein [Tianweitania sp.]|uniref:hypothetical protein n=1 Tax=Tianweitania sp. TaxID=2021634 RepID=UPI00289A72CA|nr:hypothetical protein [Tianweitania sp.]
MNLRVIKPPAPIVEPMDILGGHEPDDRAVRRMIAAATRTIDGPNGWLKRCLGPQTLELSMDRWCGQNHRLPCGPVIKIVSVNYLDGEGGQQSVADGNWRLCDDRIWFGCNFSRPALGAWPGVVRIRYEAGYNGDGEGKTGEIPPEAIQAVILLAQHLKATGAENLFVASEEVEGVGSQRFVVSDQADALVKRAVDSLLNGLRVISL